MNISSKIFIRRITTKTRIQDVYFVSTARTPMGSFNGSLKEYTAPKLGAIAVENAIERAGIMGNIIEEAIMGCVVQSGLGQAPARQAALFGGLDNTTPSTTLNKVCASGMKSIMIGSSSLALGLKDVIIVGGMESLSNTPFYLARGSIPYGGSRLKDGCDFDALTDVYTGWHMGKCAEETAKKMKISREEQDEYALLSYKRYQKALEAGIYENEIIPVKGKHGVEIKMDEEILNHHDDGFNKLKTIWGPTITAGSSSKLADGAAALVLMNEDGLKKHGLSPIGKIIGFEDSAGNPTDWPSVPARGMENLLKRFKLSVDDVALWEINEAFALVVLANMKLVGIKDLNKVNKDGGAISMGHPLGASGARITLHLLNSLSTGELGIASLCNGGGGASSILIQKL